MKRLAKDPYKKWRTLWYTKTQEGSRVCIIAHTIIYTCEYTEVKKLASVWWSNSSVALFPSFFPFRCRTGVIGKLRCSHYSPLRRCLFFPLFPLPPFQMHSERCTALSSSLFLFSLPSCLTALPSSKSEDPRTLCLPSSLRIEAEVGERTFRNAVQCCCFSRVRAYFFFPHFLFVLEKSL